MDAVVIVTLFLLAVIVTMGSVPKILEYLERRRGATYCDACEGYVAPSEARAIVDGAILCEDCVLAMKREARDTVQ